jgi:cob(I)alamin adenosyltransferase
LLYTKVEFTYNASMLEKGLVQIYTGDGKGKTTAAFGLAIRAAGHGNRVLIFQFLKPPNLNSGEQAALQSETAYIKIETIHLPWDMSKDFDDELTVRKMQKEISAAMKRLSEIAQKGLYDMLILDEIVFCLSKGLANLSDIKGIINAKARGVEIVLTGRGATKELIDLADLVTEMKNIKHPFDKGISTRRGIEF